MAKNWSQMTPDELLDEAQALFKEILRTQPQANGLYQPLIRAQALVSAAHTRALVLTQEPRT